MLSIQGPAWILPLILCTTYLLLLLAERRFPLRAASQSLWSRLPVNLIITALTLVTATIIVRPAVEHYLGMTSGDGFGVLALLDLPVAVEFGMAFLLFDWSFYWWHRAHHQIPLLWRFHNIHHIDPDLDVTTAFRFHAVEIAYSAIFRVAQIVLIAPVAWMYLIYELAFQLNTMFHHSNVKLPLRLEQIMNRVLVTPRMHGIHHSNFRLETDSNYSTVFSWWDRLHRSLRLNIAQRDIRVGVPGYSLPKDNQPLCLLSLPFRQQRHYWRDPSGAARVTRPSSSAGESLSRMRG